MAESPEDTEKSISLGPAALMTCIDSFQEFSQQPVLSGPDFITPPKKNPPLALEDLSVSSIASVDTSLAGPLHAAFSPDAEFRPDILMSTINKHSSNSVEDLSISLGPIPALTEEQCGQVFSLLENEEPPDDYGSISMGPLPGFSVHQSAEADPIAQERTLTPVCVSNLAVKIEEFDNKLKKAASPVPVVPVPTEKPFRSKEVQTDVFQCQKCDELQHDYNQKLIEVANEFQTQYVAQLKLADQYALASEESNKQIKDLMSQLEGADKQLKASRAFLEQQAVEREQEREEAIAQQTKLKAQLTEKEKEIERAKESISHLSTELQSIHEALNEKEQIVEELSAVQHRMEQELQMLRISQADLEDENSGLQAVLEMKEKLLKAQAEQITALHNELEHQLYAQSESERENDLSIERRQPEQAKHTDVPETTQSTTATEVPSLFDEVQHLIVRLLRKVESSTRAMESAQLSPKKRQGPNLLQSPRSAMTPSTSTEDISIKDRNQNDVENLRDMTPSPSDIRCNSDPERTLNFLQQLDGKLAALNRIEEATCKRIADLEAELQRVSQSEKRSVSKAKELEQQVQKHERLMHDVEAEKRELQTEHVELMKRISSLENRLEEQRRSAVLGVTNNPHAEKCRILSEEKQQLYLSVKEKEDVMKEMQKEITELHERIASLMKAVQDKENESSRQTNYDISQASSIERLRDFPQQQDGSINWSKFQMAGNSPIAISTSPLPMHSTHLRPPSHQHVKELPLSPHVSLELDELRSKLAKSERQRTLVEDELANANARIALLEPLEKRNAALDDVIEQTDKEKAELQGKYEALEKEYSECLQQLKHVESAKERLGQLEQEIAKSRFIANDFEALQQSYATLKRHAEEHKEQSCALIDTLKKRCSELETSSAAHKDLTQDNEILKRKCQALEAEVVTQQEVITSMDVLRQRYLQLQEEMVNVQQTSLQQASQFRLQNEAKAKLISELQAQLTSPDITGLKAQVTAKDRAISDLKAMLQLAESGKSKVEEALKQLQAEVNSLKQAQKSNKSKRLSAPIEETVECTNLEGPSAPPDLLAPSFIEFLGSTTSSRCSSSMGLAQRTIDSNTLIDCSLPSSMIGKKTLKQVQMAGEQLLSLGKQIADQQKKAIVVKVDQATSANPLFEDDLETTLKDVPGPSVNESQLLKRIEMLETELEMERLLLQDQRATNARQQQQIIQLIAQQRLAQTIKPQQESPRASSPLHSLKSADVNKYLHYRALKLESMRKNLIYQKRFLSGVLQELDPNHNKRPVTASDLKPIQRFRSTVFTVIAVERMRYVMRQWRHRRKLIENQSSSC